jgi:hypothetical protein
MYISTSPSELTMNDDCSLARDYRYVRGLRPREEKRSPTLASGTAVHYAVEHFTRNYPQTVPDDDDVEALALECLRAEFMGDDDEGEKNVKKFTAGVKRAVGRIPEWVWKAEWVPERDVSATFYFPCTNFGADKMEFANCPQCLEVELHGRPDLYRTWMTEEDVPVLEIVDVKTTETDPLSFVLWTPQLRMYAAMLFDEVPGAVIQYRYVCTPTAASAKPPVPPAVIFTSQSHARTVSEIGMYAKKLLVEAEPRYSRRCDWCDYKKACAIHITGGDVEGILKEEYSTREERSVLREQEVNSAY